MRAALLLIGWVALFAAIENDAVSAERPNIILCMGDDHGWDETGYNGHPHLKTPVLDEMASTGLRLDHFYSGHPTCSPTRGSFLTGRHPVRYGTFAPNWSMRPEEITIAHLLKKAGYRTAHFGKWHVGTVKAGSPLNPGAMGFDTWVSHDNFFEMNPSLSRNGAAPEVIRGEGSEVVIDETIRFIKEAQKEKQPFLAVVWFGSPHEPYSGLAKDLTVYDELKSLYPGKTVKLTSMKTGKPTTRPLGDVLRERYAEITAMDRAIGHLRSYLKQSGLRENTLLWYCGDNGSPSGASITTPFRGQKGAMYEGGIRVPGIIEWPGVITKPRTSKVNAVTSDMLPTLCGLLSLAPPKRELDGVDLTPLLRGAEFQRTKPICFWSFDSSREASNRPYIPSKMQIGTTPLVKMMAGKYTRTFRNFHHPTVGAADYAGARAILSGSHKLVVTGKPGKEKIELFDLHQDRAEKSNLTAQEGDVANRLGAELRAWQTSVLESLTGADYRN